MKGIGLLQKIIAEVQKLITAMMEKMDRFEEAHDIDELIVDVHIQRNQRIVEIKFHYESDDIDNFIFTIKLIPKKKFLGMSFEIIEEVGSILEDNEMNTKNLEQILMDHLYFAEIQETFYMDFHRSYLIIRVMGQKNFAQFTFNRVTNYYVMDEQIIMGKSEFIEVNELNEKHIVERLTTENANPVIPYMKKLLKYFEGEIKK